ncbi:zinc ABC transporter permease AztB [Klenkia taihuensis]|uniref:Manganese/iron transport system permease protein n=1 Tax=Klenkia taihuensis TaxID=1225127 RepID=A0A1I1TYL6_9ACTN|nr:zinc ABC transporter permease AztB [Klenkia taihuensis]GHE07062.1 ABC transporter permease [Klenkia taihuensis]SFD63736.1 manganese/iron transport system permease protein [Klenkia taihuensis]
MAWLVEPFVVPFMQRALLGGILAALICAVVGTWVLVRGMAFLGEALAHGMLPGVAVATLAGWPPVLGAAASAAVMSVGVGAVARRARLSSDTAIGLLFAGMLALGVVIVSRSRSFATDLTSILFGDVLAIRSADIALLGGALVVLVAASVLLHRPFLALSFDTRTAAVLGMRPRAAHVAMVLLVATAVVVSYQALGALLVVALLLAPAAAARQWTHRLAPTVGLGAAFGAVSVAAGLLLSWHAGTAGGASIALCSVALVAVSVAVRATASTRP